MKSLYLCYFGLCEPLVQTQVLPYLRKLSESGFEPHLLTFEGRARESWSAREITARRAQLSREGIKWFFLTYHKRPSLLAKVYDIVAGALHASLLVRRYGVRLLHARGHVAAAIGVVVQVLTGARLIFDIRGLMPEEYTDGGLWPHNGYLYRLTKLVERRLLASADGFVVLSQRGKHLLFPGCRDTDAYGRAIEVIPCCVDFVRFERADGVRKENIQNELGCRGYRVFAYLGALGGWYLTEELAKFLAVAYTRDPLTFSLILTQSPHELLAGKLRELGVPERQFRILTVSPDDIPCYLKAADFGLSFIKPCYSKLASCPTKVPEYLASGLPVICNAGIGDLDQIVKNDRVGIVVPEFSEMAYLEALQKAERLLADPDLFARCRGSARLRFDLDTVGAARYKRLYQRLLKTASTPNAAVI